MEGHQGAQQRVDAQQAGHHVLDALAEDPLGLAPRPDNARKAAPVGASTTVAFPPRRGVRRFLSTVLLLVLLAGAAAGYLAYQDPNTLSIGVAGTLGVLLLVTWAIRVGTPLTRLTVRGGQLDVQQGGLHLKFDLASRFTAIDVHGTAGRRGWRVDLGRGTERAFTVDSSIVDPAEFMRVLRSYRPE